MNTMSSTKYHERFHRIIFNTHHHMHSTIFPIHLPWFWKISQSRGSLLALSRLFDRSHTTPNHKETTLMSTTAPADKEKPAGGEQQTLLEKAAKFIPGLGSVAPTKKPKQRSRAKVGSKSVNALNGEEAEPATIAHEEPTPVTKPTLDLSNASILPEEPAEPLKRPSAAQTVTKRIRAAQKKIVGVL